MNEVKRTSPSSLIVRAAFSVSKINTRCDWYHVYKSSKIFFLKKSVFIIFDIFGFSKKTLKTRGFQK